jgi:hypothetical protein
MLIFSYVPESHWYYAIHGMDDKAKQVMERTYGKVEGYNIEAEYAIIKNTLNEERSQNSFQTTRDVINSYLLPFKGRDKWRLMAGTIPLMCCQLSGVNLFGNYSACAYYQNCMAFSSSFHRFLFPCRF